jgi:hypothetical protein
MAPGKGERGRTAKPEGTNDPDKKRKPGERPGTREWKDQNGKTTTGPWSGDERKGGDGSGVNPTSRYPDGQKVGSWRPPEVDDTSKARAVIGGIAIIGAIICALAEPCGAAMAGVVSFTGAAVAVGP